MVALHLHLMHAKTLGDRLRQARDNRRLTQDQLASRIGVSRSLISQWETGLVQEIGASHLYQAARVLRVSLDWLLEGDDEPACGEPPPPDYGLLPTALVTAWAALTQAQRAELLAEAERRAEHNRALLEELAGKPR